MTTPQPFSGDKKTSKLDIEQYREMIRNLAVPILDEHVGIYWPYAIDLLYLNMGSTYMSIGGQLFGSDYEAAVVVYKRTDLGADETIFGNSSVWQNGHYREDTRAWKEVILELRKDLKRKEAWDNFRRHLGGVLPFDDTEATIELSNEEYRHMVETVAVPILDNCLGTSWPFAVDLSTLDMTSDRNNIAAQLFGSITAAIVKIYDRYDVIRERSIFGLSKEGVRASRENHPDTNTWKEVIEKLRKDQNR